MEISKQIKKYRNELGYSQEELSQKIFVSRQTISSWENSKSYPDIKSLLMLSNVFDVSLDELVKGDVEEMKNMVETNKVDGFKRDSNIFAILLALAILLPAPIFVLNKTIGYVIYGIITILDFYYGYKIDKQKKQLNIHTYKEILAFTENRGLTEKERNQEEGKYIYQKIFMVLLVMVISFFVAYLGSYLLDIFM